MRATSLFRSYTRVSAVTAQETSPFTLRRQNPTARAWSTTRTLRAYPHFRKRHLHLFRQRFGILAPSGTSCGQRARRAVSSGHKQQDTALKAQCRYPRRNDLGHGQIHRICRHRQQRLPFGNKNVGRGGFHSAFLRREQYNYQEPHLSTRYLPLFRQNRGQHSALRSLGHRRSGDNFKAAGRQQGNFQRLWSFAAAARRISPRSRGLSWTKSPIIRRKQVIREQLKISKIRRYFGERSNICLKKSQLSWEATATSLL